MTIITVWLNKITSQSAKGMVSNWHREAQIISHWPDFHKQWHTNTVGVGFFLLKAKIDREL